MTSEERHEARYQRRKAERLRRRAAYQKTFDEVFTYSNLYRAYHKCTLGVSWKTQVQSVKAVAPVYVYDLYDELQTGRYKLSPYKEFDIYEHGKPRHILSVYFRDRVVQRCLADELIIPVLTRSFIYASGACIPGKGVQFQRRLLRCHLVEFLRHNKGGYVLQYDFSKFFANLDHKTIKELISKYIDDERCLGMIYEFVDSFPNGKGLGLGSELSYLFALMLANELDHFIKEQLCCRQYGRYMDDGYLLCRDIDEARAWRDAIANKCEELHITLNRNKTHLVKLSHCFIFLKRKYQITTTGKILELPNDKSFTKMRKKLKKLHGRIDPESIKQSYQAWRSSLIGADCYRKLKQFDKETRQWTQ